MGGGKSLFCRDNAVETRLIASLRIFERGYRGVEIGIGRIINYVVNSGIIILLFTTIFRFSVNLSSVLSEIENSAYSLSNNAFCLLSFVINLSNVVSIYLSV